MTTYTLPLDARAANVRYYPSRDGPVEKGWNYPPNSGGIRKTTFAGAKIDIDWVGTGIQLFGIASQSAYNLTLDGGEPQVGQPMSDGTLGTFSELDNKNHTVSIEVVGGSSEVVFSQAHLTLQLGETGYVRLPFRLRISKWTIYKCF
jgi:hypothetical protein